MKYLIKLRVTDEPFTDSSWTVECRDDDDGLVEIVVPGAYCESPERALQEALAEVDRMEKKYGTQLRLLE